MQKLLKRFFISFSINIPVNCDVTNRFDKLFGVVGPKRGQESEIALEHLAIKYFNLAHLFEIPTWQKYLFALPIVFFVNFGLNFGCLQFYSVLGADLLLLSVGLE
jgi:hypothetical protein